MYQDFHRRLAYCCLAVAIIFVFIALQYPSQSSNSAAVFSNMPSENHISEAIGDGQKIAVIFDVPDGQDYQITSLQVPIMNNDPDAQTITARICADNAGAPGEIVMEIASEVAPNGFSTVVFMPTDKHRLVGGQHYWLVLSNPGAGVEWWSADPPITPTGVFTFVDNGLMHDGVFTSQATHRYSFTMDANPIAAR